MYSHCQAEWTNGLVGYKVDLVANVCLRQYQKTINRNLFTTTKLPRNESPQMTDAIICLYYATIIIVIIIIIIIYRYTKKVAKREIIIT